MTQCLHAFCTFFVFLASNAADFENRADGMTDAVGIRRVQLPPTRLVLGVFSVLSTRFLLPILPGIAGERLNWEPCGQRLEELDRNPWTRTETLGGSEGASDGVFWRSRRLLP